METDVTGVGMTIPDVINQGRAGEVTVQGTIVAPTDGSTPRLCESATLMMPVLCSGAHILLEGFDPSGVIVPNPDQPGGSGFAVLRGILMEPPPGYECPEEFLTTADGKTYQCFNGSWVPTGPLGPGNQVVTAPPAPTPTG